jgi:hypothetical protein
MSTKPSSTYLPAGLTIPVAEADDLSAPYWAGLRQNRLMVQHCTRCQTWQFGPEWLCHRCHTFDPQWVEVELRGRIFSWERSVSGILRTRRLGSTVHTWPCSWNFRKRVGCAWLAIC